MTNFGAVLDTCVLYPMPLADTLLLCAQNGAYTFYWTEHLMAELRQVMLKQYTAAQADYRDQQMRKTFTESEVRGYRQLIKGLSLPDKDDRHVLAAAIRSQSERIVTYNLGDFPLGVLEEYDIQAYHPDEFLLNMVDMFPQPILNVLRRQVGNLKHTSLSLEDLLGQLEQKNHLYRFVAQVRQFLLHEQQQTEEPPVGIDDTIVDIRVSRRPRKRGNL